MLHVFDTRIDKARLYNIRAPSLRSSCYQRCSILKESGKLRWGRVCVRDLFLCEHGSDCWFEKHVL